MAYGYMSRADLAELRLRKDFASVCVPPWRPDLRPERSEAQGAWPAFGQVLRDLFLLSRGPAYRRLKPENTGR